MTNQVRKSVLFTLALPLFLSARVFADTTNAAPATTPAAAVTAPATALATDSDKDAIDQAVDGVANVFADDDGSAKKKNSNGPFGPLGPPMFEHRERDAGGQLEDIVVPLGAFIFVIVLVLGGRFLRERTAHKRLELLRLMIEKGQPISDNVVKEMISNDEKKRDLDPKQAHIRQLRNGFVLTGIGLALCIYRFASTGGHHEKALAIGLLSLGLGIGLLIAYKLSDKHFQA
jgi:hypothetical protein